MKIKFTNVKFLYLYDRKYFNEYNEENDFTPEEIATRIEELETDYFEVELLEDDEIDINEDEDTIYDIMVQILEDECGEYFTDFDYEINP